MKTEEELIKQRARCKDWYLRKKAGNFVPKPAGRPANTPEVLWSKVNKRGPDECWPWTGFVNHNGYGRTWINDRGYYAHRVIYDLANPNEITREQTEQQRYAKLVLHKCDNPVCCNPAHLYVGSHDQNMKDKVERNRSPKFSGGRAPRCKLTMDQAREARKLFAEGISKKMIAEKFNVRAAIINLLVQGKTYREDA